MSDTAPTRSTYGTLEPGMEIGVSHWVEVTQAMISGFGDVTLDPDPMHIDPEWAKANGPYGGTIAFGFLTMSLLTHLLHSAMGTNPSQAEDENGHFLNYGMDYLRLLAPVKVGARIRGKFKVLDARLDAKGRQIAKFGVEVEIEGEEKPALVAEWLSIQMPPE